MINMKKDKRIWKRMGRELAALHDLIVEIQCDPEYQMVMDRKTWDKLHKLTYYLNIVRAGAENRMAKYVPDWWTVSTFFPIDNKGAEAAVKPFRQKAKGKNER